MNTSSTNTAQRSPRRRRLAVLGAVAAAFVAVIATVALSGGTSALLGSEDTGTATVTYADHTQTVFTNGTANTLNPTWALVPGGQASQEIGISNGDVKSGFVLTITPPATGSVDPSQIAGISVAITDANTGDTVLAQTSITSPSLAGGVNLGVLSPGQSRTFRVTLFEDASVTVGGGSVTTGLKLVGTQVL